MQLYKQYHPPTWKQIAGHKDVVSRLVARRDAGRLGGSAYWIHGPSGTGKTTITGHLASEIADSFGTKEHDVSALTPAALKEIERGYQMRCIGEKTGRAMIVNEAHGLRADTVRSLMDVIDRIPSHVVWIFTTTSQGMDKFDGIDADPLLSRCYCIKLEADLEAFAKRARKIAEHAGLGGAPPEAFLKLAKDCKGNLRMMLSRIEAGEMQVTKPTEPEKPPKPARRQAEPLLQTPATDWR